ncbi:gluconokinase [Martelella alba]|uniref:Gluconokinase n=2 Tax=Martelella alba TaxID=2590451 RepID=A0A506UGI1_9HYPH|nr:gluconokinase [Martelella alba]TPW31167.1 gluconokinase [Martelella alba]
MGVSGCGKSSTAALLADRIGARFIEGDALHPRANIEKMRQGFPLDDNDRWPWLDRIGAVLGEAVASGTPVIISCSALKKAYRDRLRKATGGPLAFVYLEGPEEILADRMSRREGHFMPLSLLKSQIATLEVPSGEAGVVTVSIAGTPEEICTAALEKLMTLHFA